MDTKNMPKYAITHPKHAGCVGVAVYELPWTDGDGRTVSRLRAVQFNQGCNAQFIRAVLARLPGLVEKEEARSGLAFAKLKVEGCQVQDVAEKDLGFEAFWKAYGYKVGGKARAEKLWGRLGEEERLLALGGIWKQRLHSERHKTDMPYPETYLSQRRWENEF